MRKLKPLEPVPLARSKFDQETNEAANQSRPQPAPRHSIVKSLSSPTKESTPPDISFNATTTTHSGHPDSSGSSYLNTSEDQPATSSTNDYIESMAALPPGSDSLRGPPPLPPKPKVLPIKPSNWAGGHSSNVANLSSVSAKSSSMSPAKETSLNGQPQSYPYLDEPSSSFV